MRSGALAAAVALLCVHPASMQTASSLPATIEALRTAANLPGVGGVLFDSETISEISVSGVRKLGDPAVVTPADLWHIGSLTKSFTSTLAGTFVERGELTWTATLGGLLGPDRARKFALVTLAQVLSHRGGLPANPPQADMLALRISKEPLPAQRRSVIDKMFDGEPRSVPGTTFLYSNLDYILVGSILEAKAGSRGRTSCPRRCWRR